MMKRAKSIEKRQNSAIEEKSKLLKNVESYSELEIRPLKFLTIHFLNFQMFLLVMTEKPCAVILILKLSRVSVLHCAVKTAVENQVF